MTSNTTPLLKLCVALKEVAASALFQGQVVKQLTQLITSLERLSANKQQKALLQVLAELLDLVHSQLSQGYEEQLSCACTCILDAIRDLVNSGQCSGSEYKRHCGMLFITRFMTFLCSRACSDVKVLQGASALLVDLGIACSHNLKLLSEQKALCHDLFGAYFLGCGNFPVQADLMDVLYRCGKHKHLVASCTHALPAEVLTGLHTAMAKPSRELNLDEELRSLVMTMNAHAGPKASVWSLKADSITFCHCKGLVPDVWLDFGSRGLTVTYYHHQDEDDAAPSTLYQAYEDIDVVSSQQSSVQSSCHIRFKKISPTVQAAIEHEPRWLDLKISCQKAEVATMSMNMPQLLERLKLWPEQQNNMRSQDSLCTPSANPAPKQSIGIPFTKEVPALKLQPSTAQHQARNASPLRFRRLRPSGQVPNKSTAQASMAQAPVQPVPVVMHSSQQNLLEEPQSSGHADNLLMSSPSPDDARQPSPPQLPEEQPRPGELLHMSDPLAEEAEPPQSSAVSNTTSDVQAEVESYKTGAQVEKALHTRSQPAHGTASVRGATASQDRPSAQNGRPEAQLPLDAYRDACRQQKAAVRQPAQPQAGGKAGASSKATAPASKTLSRAEADSARQHRQGSVSHAGRDADLQGAPSGSIRRAALLQAYVMPAEALAAKDTAADQDQPPSLPANVQYEQEAAQQQQQQQEQLQQQQQQQQQLQLLPQAQAVSGQQNSDITTQSISQHKVIANDDAAPVSKPHAHEQSGSGIQARKGKAKQPKQVKRPQKQAAKPANVRRPPARASKTKAKKAQASVAAQEAKPLQQQLEQQDDELEGAAAAADEAQCTGRRRANQQQANNSEPQWLTEQQAAEQQTPTPETSSEVETGLQEAKEAMNTTEEPARKHVPAAAAATGFKPAKQPRAAIAASPPEEDPYSLPSASPDTPAEAADPSYSPRIKQAPSRSIRPAQAQQHEPARVKVPKGKRNKRAKPESAATAPEQDAEPQQQSKQKAKSKQHSRQVMRRLKPKQAAVRPAAPPAEEAVPEQQDEAEAWDLRAAAEEPDAFDHGQGDVHDAAEHLMQQPHPAHDTAHAEQAAAPLPASKPLAKRKAARALTPILNRVRVEQPAQQTAHQPEAWPAKAPKIAPASQDAAYEDAIAKLQRPAAPARKPAIKRPQLQRPQAAPGRIEQKRDDEDQDDLDAQGPEFPTEENAEDLLDMLPEQNFAAEQAVKRPAKRTKQQQSTCKPAVLLSRTAAQEPSSSSGDESSEAEDSERHILADARALLKIQSAAGVASDSDMMDAADNELHTPADGLLQALTPCKRKHVRLSTDAAAPPKLPRSRSRAELTSSRPSQLRTARIAPGSAKKVVLSQPTPRRSAKPTVTPASDSEEGEDAAQASLRAVVSSMMAKLSPDDKDSDDEDSKDDGMADLQRTLAQVVTTKKEKARQKQLGILEEVRTRIRSDMDELTAAVTKDAQQTADLAVRSYAKLGKQLSNQMLEMRQAEEEHKAQQEARLQEYHQIYSKSKPMKQELQAIVKKKQHGAKRKLAELQATAEELLADAEAQISKSKSSASKMPGLARLLKAFV